MNNLAPLPSPPPRFPTLVEAAGARARTRFVEFFAANIRNNNTRRAYAQATRKFLALCESAGVASIADVRPLHVAAYMSSSAASDPCQPSNSASPQSATYSTGL